MILASPATFSGRFPVVESLWSVHEIIKTFSLEKTIDTVMPPKIWNRQWRAQARLSFVNIYELTPLFRGHETSGYRLIMVRGQRHYLLLWEICQAYTTRPAYCCLYGNTWAGYGVRHTRVGCEVQPVLSVRRGVWSISESPESTSTSTDMTPCASLGLGDVDITVDVNTSSEANCFSHNIKCTGR